MSEMEIDLEGLEFRLNELPNEILLQIMINYGANDLLVMANVCQRFRTISKEAFKKRHRTMNDCFRISSWKNSNKMHTTFQSFFEIFGENMVAIEICFDQDDSAFNDWAVGIMKMYCTSLERIVFDKASLTLFSVMPKLKSIRLDDWKDEDLGVLIEFISNHS